MRILFVISSLSLGGSERVALNLCSHWSKARHRVTLVTVASAEHDFYAADPQVDRIALGLYRESRNTPQFLSNNIRRIRSLSSVIWSQRPDVIVSFGDTTNVLAILARVGIRIPLVVSERTDPRAHQLGRV